MDASETKNQEQSEFKKPVLIGRIGKLPRKAKTSEVNKNEGGSSESTSNNVSLSSVLMNTISSPVPYREPKWSGISPEGSEYALEVLKSGMIIKRIDLTNKPFYVFGRYDCDVTMAHATVSRHHCILQYKAFVDEGEPPCGWYLYDLDSTHGTFLNKVKLKPDHYTRLRVGHHIKFGCSSRTYILVGPDFDCEGESQLSVSEIKRRAQQMKLERERMMIESMEQRERARLQEERKIEERGIDWGIGEDAEDETDLTDNPFAVTGNEDLYLDDPKKTLRGYFEREGHDLNYDCEERGIGQFVCRVQLPLDDARGNPVVAEVIHRGKKKEAVIACALEACRVLDRVGVLRQAQHESRRRKERDWGADDFYDSDEDTFLDRTGSVERKRKLRMQKHGAAEQDNSDKPLTYDDLLKKIIDIETKISLEEKTLNRLRETSKCSQQADGEADALDAFMSTLGKPSMAHKADISRTKMTIQKLKAELAKTQRLAEIARPAHAPPLLKKDDKLAIKVTGNAVVYGKRIRLKEDIEKHTKVKKAIKQEESEFVEEVDSDEEKEQTEECKTQKKTELKCTSDKDISDGEEKKSEENGEGEEEKKIGEVKKIYGPMRPPENYVIPEDYFDQESDRDLPEIMEKEE